MEREVRITLRLPANLHDQIKELLKTSRRSLNSEIIVQIERGLAAKKEQSE